jgi:hypothetical protein
MEAIPHKKRATPISEKPLCYCESDPRVRITARVFTINEFVNSGVTEFKPVKSEL